MNGPEHYREAEAALAMAVETDYGAPDEHYHLTRAQVHATLALAAASAPVTCWEQIHGIATLGKD